MALDTENPEFPRWFVCRITGMHMQVSNNVREKSSICTMMNLRHVYVTTTMSSSMQSFRFYCFYSTVNYYCQLGTKINGIVMDNDAKLN